MNWHKRLGLLAALSITPTLALAQVDEHAGHNHAPGEGHEGEVDLQHLGAAQPAGTLPEWSSETLDLFDRLGVQHEGRVKPISTVAGFTLLSVNNKRTAEDAEGEKHKSNAWMLAALFFPEDVKDWPIFRVESRDCVTAIGVSFEGKKGADRYSYNELEPGFAKLFSLGHKYAQIDAKARQPVEGQIVNLGQSVATVERYLHLFDFARAELDPSGVPGFEGREHVTYSEVLAKAEDLRAAVFAVAEDDPERDAIHAATMRLLNEVSVLAERAVGLALIPPTVGPEEEPEWTTIGDLSNAAFTDGPMDPRVLAIVSGIEGMARERENPEAFTGHLREVAGASRSLVEARGEQEKIDFEVTFYNVDPFYRSLVLYLLGFVAIALSWLMPKGKMAKVALGFTAAGLAVNVGGIVMRCILRSRPPVSTLYETVIFITAAAVLSALIMERIDRRRIAAAVAPFLGGLGLFVAMRFEALQGTDTMPQLVAVLDTNFWLSIHVTCITLGYSAGLLAAALANLFVIGKVLGIRRKDADGYRALGRMVYGTLCFALIFSVVGTILGGVWANDSWGRFWGWDPKENGALMIVLAQLTILHARMGGYLKPFGISIATILQGCVVAFSWWGVNLLGIGLHSYGFTEGIASALRMFYGIQFGLALMGGIWWVFQASSRPSTS